jgi:hypothetical protein
MYVSDPDPFRYVMYFAGVLCLAALIICICSPCHHHSCRYDREFVPDRHYGNLEYDNDFEPSPPCPPASKFSLGYLNDGDTILEVVVYKWDDPHSNAKIVQRFVREAK